MCKGKHSVGLEPNWVLAEVGIKTCLLGIKRKINPCGAAVGRSYPLTVKYVFVFFISPSFLWQRDTV